MINEEERQQLIKKVKKEINKLENKKDTKKYFYLKGKLETLQYLYN